MPSRLAAASCSAVCLLAVSCAPAAHSDPIPTTAVVVKIVDGDTVDVRDDVRGRLRIRLLGIDTPEVHRPHYSVGCFGPEATEFAQSTLQGRRVAIITDAGQGQFDRYGRTLAYLDKADGWDYSIEAARAGFAHAYIYENHPPPSVTPRSQPQNKKHDPPGAGYGAHRATDTPNRCRHRRPVPALTNTRPRSKHQH